MSRFFNTSGPIQTNNHYYIDPLTRVDWEEIQSLINDERYFILHAPRQTGKSWDDKIWQRQETEQGLPIGVWGM